MQLLTDLRKMEDLGQRQHAARLQHDLEAPAGFVLTPVRALQGNRGADRIGVRCRGSDAV